MGWKNERCAFLCCWNKRSLLYDNDSPLCTEAVVSMILATNLGYGVCIVYWQLLWLHVFLPHQEAINKLQSHPHPALRFPRQLLGPAHSTSPARIEQSLSIRHLPAFPTLPTAAAHTRVEC